MSNTIGINQKTIPVADYQAGFGDFFRRSLIKAKFTRLSICPFLLAKNCALGKVSFMACVGVPKTTTTSMDDALEIVCPFALSVKWPATCWRDLV